jgi:hypothetical protein
VSPSPTVRASVRAAGCVLGSFLAVWCLVGDAVDEAGGEDRIFEPPALSVPLRVTLALIAVSIVVASAYVSERQPAMVRRESRHLVVAATVIGAIAGTAVRIVGARTVGANIGGGGIVVLAPILVPGALAYLGVLLVNVHRASTT